MAETPPRVPPQQPREPDRTVAGRKAGGGRTLRVCALYPDLMNIYADRGNILLLERRCAWRGIGFDVQPPR